MIRETLVPEWFYQLGPMGWPLAVCSLLALTLCFERLVFHVRSCLRKGREYQKLVDYLTESKEQPKQIRDEIVSIMLDDLQPFYYRGIKELSLIGTISPMLGLIGTILGIIATFRVISSQSGPVSPAMIADGLWEAMLTTAAGLLIALPALLMAHFFKQMSQARLSDFCLRLNKLSMSFELEGKDENPAMVRPQTEKHLRSRERPSE